MIGNQDCISRHTCRHRLPVVLRESTARFPTARRNLAEWRQIAPLAGRACWFAASGYHCHAANEQNRYCFDHASHLQ
jgi:hypothetical protein